MHSHKPKMEFALLTRQLIRYRKEEILLYIQVISLVSSMDLDSQPKPESELISLIKQIISVFNTKPHSESELVSLVTQTMLLGVSKDSDSELPSLISQLVSLRPEPELTSLITRVLTDFRSMNYEPRKFISVCPQALVEFDQEKIRAVTQVFSQRKEKCLIQHMKFWRYKRQILFQCRNPLHPHHSLQLVITSSSWIPRQCYCCDEKLRFAFYYCEACDYAMNFDCVEKPPVLSMDNRKWHHHPLALFPSHDSLTCHLCAIKDSTCPFYICPPCGFVVHQKCLSLPLVIRISRHPHRISFTPSFDKGDWFCSVCRRKINNDYGGYSCIKDGCLYVAHSRCATQSNVWDGIELEGVPEETEEEELEAFVRISDGIIQHFSHQHPHLRLVENNGKEYDEKNMCQACIMPIYFGSFYSCMTCEFILHEDCANLSRKVHHPIHPHMLTLVGGYDGVIDYFKDTCSACSWVCTDGFFYECGKKECLSFKLHVHCATISEPLLHGSHMHPLFLTSKPREERACSVCKFPRKETFNCIEECNFSLCFRCATIPQKVRYKHDKHILHLTYGEETSTEKKWCEACEKKIHPKHRFYKCDEYCCVTLHIECLIGRDLFMKPGSSYNYNGKKAVILANNQHMSRPICFCCGMHCPFAVAFQCCGKILCSMCCMLLV